MSRGTPERYQINTTSFDYYWKKGAGASLLERLGFTPDLRHAGQYKHYLFEVDQPADAVVRQLYNKMGFGQAHAILKAYMHRQMVAPEHGKLLDLFFQTFETHPSWLDRNKLKKGVELSLRSGIPGLMVLRNYCLMGGYESAAINKPLIYTGALKKGAAKRITETTIFWVGITREGAFDAGGNGLWHVLSTRMIHAFSRISILDKTDWDNERWGMPLNTWDMLATQLGFSIVFLTGIELMGFQPTEEEKEGLFHFWKYIGYLLGIPLGLLPNNEHEAIEALYYWTMTQSAGDADSIALARALVNETVVSGYPRNKLARHLMQQLHLFFNYYFLGDYSCSLLQIPKPWFNAAGRLLLWRIKKLEKKIKDPASRKRLIQYGGNRQQNALDIYLKYKMR